MHRREGGSEVIYPGPGIFTYANGKTEKKKWFYGTLKNPGTRLVVPLIYHLRMYT